MGREDGVRSYMNAVANITTIDAWDNPAEQIAFLEDTLRGRDWRVSVRYPDASSASLQRLHEAKTLYERRGYIASQAYDTDHRPVLELHRLGIGTSPMAVWREMGLAKGTARLITEPTLPLRSLLSTGASTVHWLDRAMHDPAKANGVFNLVAEAFLIGAGNGTKQGTMRDRKNWLQSLSGLFFLAQSAIYALIAKTNDEVAIGHLKHKFARMDRAGSDITDVRFHAESDMNEQSLWNSVVKTIRRYPVQIGAVMNDLGMIAYLGHAFANKQWNQNILANPRSTDDQRDIARKYIGAGTGLWKLNGFWKDIIGASLSLLAWPLLLLPRKPRTEETIRAHEGNPLATIWDKFRENPEGLAGVMTLGASSFRLLGADSKGNSMQRIGETIYIGGDIALMFTKNDAYGKEASKNLESLAEKIAEYINDLPYVFGAQQRQQFVANISEYLKQKGLEEVGGRPEKLHLTHADLNERAQCLTQLVMKKIGAEDRLDTLAEKALELLQQFPSEHQESVKTALIKTLAQLPWMKASESEIAAIMANSPLACRQISPPPSEAAQPHAVSKSIVALLSVVPGIDIGGSTVAMHRALTPYTNTLTQPHTTVSRVAREQRPIHLPTLHVGHTATA